MLDQTAHPAEAVALDAGGLLGWARRCVDRLREYRDEINGLNVFPVPDSDTGTNLLQTMAAALDQAEGEAAWTTEGGGRPGARDIALALGQGAVHGARGNSGVILSQLLRAIGEAATFTVVDAATLRRALRTAVTLVDHALSDPVEGTIVSVLRAAAAATARSTSTSLHEVARAAADAAAEALENTPAQLPVLRRAGVVDAGGRGLLVLLDTLVEVLTGSVPERRVYLPADGSGTASVDAPNAGRLSDSGPRFEVMYSLNHATESGVDSLRAVLRELGDSVVVAGDGALPETARWTVHVHTDEIGAVVEAGLGAGRLSDIRVSDLVVGSGENERVTEGDTDAILTEAPRSVVAIAPSGRVGDLFSDAGAVLVPDDLGTEAVVGRVLAVECSEMIVLPNGALTRAEVTSIDAGVRDRGRHVLIVPTGSVVQGLAALAVHDPSATLSVDGFSMADAAAGTRHGRVVRTDHDALTVVGRCSPGDLLGMVGHDVALIATDPVEAVRRLADLLLAGGGELLTVLLGDEFSDRRFQECLDHLASAYPGVEVVSYPAGSGEVLAHLGVE